MNKTITVFGSSIPKQGDEEYATAYELGKLLAQNNFSVCTGGYSGIMEAASKGAVDNGSDAIGVTVRDWKSIPNKFLTKNIVSDNLFERIQTLIKSGDGFVILKGGTGTLLELAAVWELMNKNILQVKPVACHSNMWKQIVEIMEVQIESEKRKTGLIKCFDNVSDMVTYLRSSINY
ncbi:MAG: LOG family protein [Ignavibacteriales bacterium]|nr:MAG: LOG family protein [Ignavibacteriales bacterium]